MLAKRVIPTMLCRGRTLVKGEKFNAWRSIGHVAQAARVHAKRGVDELLILDIAATAEGRGPDLKMVSELAEGCFIPITVGGGVRCCADIRALLLAGADKVCIGSAAAETPSFIRQAADKFGSQAIVTSIDVKGRGVFTRCGNDSIWMLEGGDPDGGIHRQMTALELAKQCAELGAGEILLQSVDRDGTMAGYDLDLIREVSQAVSVPVIASGGCSGPEDMDAAFRAGADACAAGALYAFSDCTPKSAARFLKTKGWEVRL